MEQTERIRRMEERLDAALAALRAVNAALDIYESALKDIAALDAYLGGADWRADLAADEAGALPRDLKRGVLSEDGIYDMLEDNISLRSRFRDLAERLYPGETVAGE